MITQTVLFADLTPYIQGTVTPVWVPVLVIIGLGVAALLLAVFTRFGRRLIGR